jgi:sporulation integral membrane protein YtvI
MTEGRKLLTITGITVVVYLAMRYLLPYVIPFLIAYLLVHLLNPITEKIRSRLPWKKEIIVSVLLILILSVVTVLFYFFYCQLMVQLRRIAVNFDAYYRSFCGWIDGCCRMVENGFGIRVEVVRDVVYDSLDQVTEQIRVYIVPNILNYSVRYLKKLLNAGAFLLILFVSVILLMKDYDEMQEKLQQYELYRHFHNITERMWHQGGLYLKAQMIIILIIMALCMAGLWVLGNPYFLVLGIVIGLMDALPFIGTGTVLVPMAVYLLFQGELKRAAGYLLLFLITYLAREFLEPRLIGAKLGIYPVVMVIVVYAGLYLYGVTGVVLGPVSLLLILEIWKEIRFAQQSN